MGIDLYQVVYYSGFMSVECRICPGRVCVDMNFGRLQNDNPPGQTDLAKIKPILVKIDDCEWKQTQEWFEGEGKVDTLHLGS